MRILGLPIPFTGEKQKQLALSSVTEGRGGWYPIIREPFSGAWQRNIAINNDAVASFNADFACKTLIARDIAKLRVKLVEKDDNDIWSETTNPAFSPVLRQPNDYQTRNQFWECWILSKLSRGNTYVLKVRDNRQVVVALHVLAPTRVQPLVAPDGSVFYRLNSDYLAGLETDVVVPAREIIHDRFNCMFHPLVGTPPVFASGLASMLGLNAQKASALLFENNSTPGGILTAPGEVSEVEEKRIKEEWEQRFSRVNLGRVAVLSGGMQYQKMPLTAVETQMIDQLKWSAETVCSVYHVPPYKIGIDVLPRGFTNLQALNVEYYSQSLQSLIEEIEELLDRALGIGEAEGLGTEFDTDNLLRMDSTSLVNVVKEAVGAGVMSPNEGRAKFDLTPVDGGDSPYLQQQNYSLEALAKRDAQADPFAPNTPPALPADAQPPTDTAPADQKPPPPQKDLAALTQKFSEALRLMHREAAYG
jgi:HK97 family phage portal protein